MFINLIYDLFILITKHNLLDWETSHHTYNLHTRYLREPCLPSITWEVTCRFLSPWKMEIPSLSSAHFQSGKFSKATSASWERMFPLSTA